MRLETQLRILRLLIAAGILTSPRVGISQQGVIVADQRLAEPIALGDSSSYPAAHEASLRSEGT